jgi:hypothetical protein
MEIQITILNAENKVWNITPAQLTVWRREKYAVGEEKKFESWKW